MDVRDVSTKNLFEGKTHATLEDYLEVYKSRITQDSERLFLTDFLYPLLGSSGIIFVVPQYPFIDSEGRLRRIDFAIIKSGKRLALEVNGESYHAEGIIPGVMFDDNLQRQNDIINAGWKLQRYSYNQLQDASWRVKVSHSLRSFFIRNLPELVSDEGIKPNPLQVNAL